MENIDNFLTFMERYGVPESGRFNTIDLYENRNLAGVLFGLQQLGTEVRD